MKWTFSGTNVISSGRYIISRSPNGRQFHLFLTDGTGRILNTLHKGTKSGCMSKAEEHRNPHAAKLADLSKRGLMSLDQFAQAFAS